MGKEKVSCRKRKSDWEKKSLTWKKRVSCRKRKSHGKRKSLTPKENSSNKTGKKVKTIVINKAVYTVLL